MFGSVHSMIPDCSQSTIHSNTRQLMLMKTYPSRSCPEGGVKERAKRTENYENSRRTTRLKRAQEESAVRVPSGLCSSPLRLPAANHEGRKVLCLHERVSDDAALGAAFGQGFHGCDKPMAASIQIDLRLRAQEQRRWCLLVIPWIAGWEQTDARQRGTISNAAVVVISRLQMKRFHRAIQKGKCAMMNEFESVLNKRQPGTHLHRFGLAAREAMGFDPQRPRGCTHSC